MRNVARRPAALLVALLFLMLSLPMPAFGAEPTGTVNVKVQATDGTPISDVAIRFTAVTGGYTTWRPIPLERPQRPTELPPGRYKATVSAIGYEEPALQLVTVSAGETQTITFTLKEPAKPGKLSGRIVDRSSEEPISQALGVKLARQSDGVPVVIRIGKDGTFSVPVIQPGVYLATTFALTWEAGQAYTTEDQSIWVTVAEGCEAWVELYVASKGTVTAQIVTPDGKVAEETQLIIMDEENQTRTFTSSAACCTTSMAPGVYTISAGGLPYEASPPQRVVVSPGKTVALTFHVQPVPTGAVRGRVLDSSGASIPGASVSLEDGMGLSAGRSVLTDAGGAFIFPRVAPGAYGIRASASGYIYTELVPAGAPRANAIQVEAGKTVTRDVTLKRQVKVQVRVVDEAGKVIPTAYLRWDGTVLRPEKDQAGNMLLSRLEGTYSLSAGATWYQESAAQRVVIGPEAAQITATIELRPLPTGTITGRVTDKATGEPVSNVSVSVLEPYWFAPTKYRTVTGADGTFTLKDVPIGEYPLDVIGQYDAERVDNVRVEAGKTTTIEVQTTAFGWLAVRVQDQEGKALPQATVRISRLGSGVWESFTLDRLGQVKRLLEAGTYRMTVNAPGYKGKVVLATDVVRGRSTSVVVTMEANK